MNISHVSRRDFLKASGGLIVTFSLRAQGPGASTISGSPPLNQLDSWIAIAADGSITAYSGKEELGQGISTAQQQLVAEELSVPFNRVKLIYCDTALTPDQAHTSGSQSHPANFNSDNLGQAGATAREALFLCKWPIKCQLPCRSANAGNFPSHSCTRFSPKCRNPAANASRTASAGCVLDTPINRTSCGLRPARSAAA